MRKASNIDKDVVLAWAVESATGAPRYILELGPERNGAKSGCECPGCKHPVQAINNGKDEYRRRPHFRHPPGAARDNCFRSASRAALRREIEAQGYFLLPGRVRERPIEGLSGKIYQVPKSRSPTRAEIQSSSFEDVTEGVLTLSDGRQLVVRLVGRGASPNLAGIPDQAAVIDIEVDPKLVAMMSPEEIREKVRLLDNQCWRRHWDDAELDQESEESGRLAAQAADDWLDDSDLPEGLSATERRETLLHREVKAIIEREKRIRLPALLVDVVLEEEDGYVSGSHTKAGEIVFPTEVTLERHYGQSIPDIVIEWTEDGWAKLVIIEVSVTNKLTEERVDRLAAGGHPVLEIDLTKVGGLVTRSELTRLVTDGLEGKIWRFHPELAGLRSALNDKLQRDLAQQQENIRRDVHYRSKPPEFWAREFIRNYIARAADGDSTARGNADQGVKSAAKELVTYGLPDPEGDYVLASIVQRLISIQENRAIGYGQGYTTAWQAINTARTEVTLAKYKWHPVYLMAIREYRLSLNDEQQASINRWRESIKGSIEKGGTLYIRSFEYDEILSLLFPALAGRLEQEYGTVAMLPKPGGSPVPIVKAANASRVQVKPEPNLWLSGDELEAWRAKYGKTSSS